jgi:dipeptide/tripeptide permease
VLAAATVAGTRGPVWALVPLLLAFGLVVYGCSPVEQAILGDLTEGALSDHAYSVFYALTFGASAVWPLVLTAVLARWGFDATFGVVGLTYVAGMLLYGRGKWTPAAAAAPS